MAQPNLTSQPEQGYILQGFEAGLRGDGRAPQQFRPMILEQGLLPQANGSARCDLGKTVVLVGIKAELGVPLPDRPDEGGVQVSVDVSPCAFQGRSSEELGAELARSLDRSLQASSSGKGWGIDRSALCIASGKSCWILCIDGMVLNADGNLVDALSIATKAALADLRIPMISMTMGEGDEDPEFELDDDPEHATKLETSGVPVVITVVQAGRAYAVDLTEEEEAACTGPTLQVAVTSQGNVCSVTKRGDAALQPGVLMEMLAAARKLAPQLLRAIDAHTARLPS